MNKFQPNYRQLKVQPVKVDLTPRRNTVSFPDPNNDHPARIYSDPEQSPRAPRQNAQRQSQAQPEVEHTWSTNLDEEAQRVGTEPIRARDILTPPPSSMFDLEQGLPEENYFLMINGTIVQTTGLLEEMEEVVYDLFFNPNSPYQDLTVDDITVLQKMKVKVGVSLL